MRVTHNFHDAEDAAQEDTLALWNKQQTDPQVVESARAYTATVAYYKAIDILRRRRMQYYEPDTLIEMAGDANNYTEQEFDTLQALYSLADALTWLRDSSRSDNVIKIVGLTAEGRNAVEISKILGIEADTVRSHLRRSRVKLWQYLQEHEL